MSDFLSELIMRSWEPATAITPRLSSRYEGPVISDTPAAARTIQEESDESFASDEIKLVRSMKTTSPARAEFTSPEDSQSPRSQQADQTRTTGVRDFDTQQSEKQQQVASPIAPQTSKPLVVVTDREQNEHTPQRMPDSDSGRIAPNTQATQKAADHSTTLTPAHKQEQAAQKATDQPTTITPARKYEAQDELPSARQQKPPDLTTRDSVLSAKPESQTVEPPEPRRPRIEVSPTITTQPRITANAEPKALPIQQAATATEQQPVINVTIGRVEVRATTSQSRVKQSSRAQSPVMSLDEYLRQRKEGER